MTADDNPDQAQVEEGVGLSAIWLIPVLALVIGAWMLYEQWRDQGPRATITFQSAPGIEVNNTKIRVRDVEVGQVEKISLSKDLKGVVIRARFNTDTEDLLVRDSQFWIVSPRIGLSGISGLNTLFSGAYIELAPGQEKIRKLKFQGLNEPPVTPSNTPGMPIILSSDAQVAYSVGDPVVYKGITVGQIEEVDFNVEERVVYYKTFVRAPYHELITANTRFWNVSGISVDLTADGINVQAASLQALLTSSVTFGVPDGMPKGEPVDPDQLFPIHPTYEAAVSPRYRFSAEYVVLIDESVRGLTPGAPVEYRGIKIGEVKAVNFTWPEDRRLIREQYRIPVLISVEPAKIGLPDSEKGIQQVQEQTESWVKSGLRAQLKTGSLLTGKLFVELQHFDDAPPAEISYFEGHPVIPTRLGDISQLTQKLEALLDKFNSLPVEQAAENISFMAKELGETAQEAQELSKNLGALLAEAEREQLVGRVTEALDAFAALTSGYASGSNGYAEITKTIEVLNSRLQELQPLLLKLNQRPNSLIFTGSQEDDLQPRATNN